MQVCLGRREDDLLAPARGDMQVQEQDTSVIRVKLLKRSRYVLGRTVRGLPVRHVQDRRRIGIWMRIAPLCGSFSSLGQRGSHRRSAGTLGFEPDRKFYLLLHDPTSTII